MKRRPPVDNWFWELFVQACGGRCCVCFEDGRLHRGHIHRHEDGGAPILENLIPVCKSCNSKYKGGSTPDGRPDGWRNAFLKLLLVQMKLGIMCKQVEACTATSLGDKPAESNGLMDLRAVEFVPETHYSTDTDPDIPPRPMDPTQARKLIWEAVEKSKDCPIPPKRPTKKRQDAMLRHAQRLGAEGFRIAVQEFLREALWVLDARQSHETVHHDSWLHFDESVDFYVADGLKRRALLAKQAKEQSELDRVYAERSRIAERERRWTRFLEVATVPSWPGMPDGDAGFIAAAAMEKADPIQDVTEARLQESNAVVWRYRKYLDVCREAELREEKTKLRVKMKQCIEWAKRVDDDDEQTEFGTRISGLLDLIHGAKDIETLRKDAVQINELVHELDPDNPRPSLEDVRF